MNSQENKNYGAMGTGMMEAYEAAVGQEMLERAGQNQCGKGVVHEILYRDRLNLQPENVLTGTRAKLAASTTAVRDDIILARDGKIVGRVQLKDTPASVNKTVQQVASGKYAGTKLMGTQETAVAYAPKAAVKGVTQKMTSTGISSKDTARIADKALGKPVALENALAGAPTAGLLGGALAGMFTAAECLLDDQYSAEAVAEESAKSAVVGAASGAASFAARELTASAVVRNGAAAGAGALAPVVPVALAVPVGYVAAKAAVIIAKPTVEGISDALYCGNPGCVLDGLKEGAWDVVDEIIEGVGSVSDFVFDGLESIGDSISDFFDNLFW